jgi:tetratricopeptide (TPR) repeat protein
VCEAAHYGRPCSFFGAPVGIVHNAGDPDDGWVIGPEADTLRWPFVPDTVYHGFTWHERASELTGHQNAGFLDTLAATYAAAGQFDQAVTTAEKALRLASANQADDLANHIRQRLELYRQGKPYRPPMPGQPSGIEAPAASP